MCENYIRESQLETLPAERIFDVLDKLSVSDLINTLKCNKTLYDNYYALFSNKIEREKLKKHVIYSNIKHYDGRYYLIEEIEDNIGKEKFRKLVRDKVISKLSEYPSSVLASKLYSIVFDLKDLFEPNYEDNVLKLIILSEWKDILSDIATDYLDTLDIHELKQLAVYPNL